MNFKKFLALLLALTMVLTIAACSKDEESDDSSMSVTDENPLEDLVSKYFSEKPDHSYLVDQAEFVEMVKAGDDIVILDIRSADAYAEGHVQGAISVPWGGTAISDSLNKIPQDKDVYIYCVSGQTAGQTVMIMNAAGINARSVKYGFKFGISKVEGVDAVVTTDVTEFGSETYDVDADVQAAADAYYAGLADVKDTTYANYKISEASLKELIDNGDDFYLLSIRKADDFAAGHIEGAENIPYGTSFADNIGDLPMDKKIVVYCYSGQTAGQTVAALKLLGYDAVSLNGGVGTPANDPIGWTNTNSGFELVTD